MRIFVLTAFVLIVVFVSFGSPPFASAQVCNSQDADCTSSSGVAGTCQDTGDGFVCQPKGSVGNTPSANTGRNIILANPLKGGGDVQTFLLSILDFVIKIGTIVVILMMVYVGYLFVVAQGKEAEIREARQALLWTVVGALILLGSQAIALGIEKTVQALSTG